MRKYLFAALAIISLAVIVVVSWVVQVMAHLPDVSALRRYRPAAAAEVLDKDGAVLTQYYDRKFRIWVPISDLPDIVIHAVVTAEDDTFFEHRGVNYKATWDALVHDVQKHRFARGGSTITQQMIKNVLLSKEKTLSRKVREYLLARQAEELLTKRRILEIYLNEVEWGENIYGIEAASRYYLDTHASELTAAEAALLAGMLPNPRYYNPYRRLDKALERRDRVLFNMQQARLITPDEYAAAERANPKLRRDSSGRFDMAALMQKNGRPCYQQALEQILLFHFGEGLFRSGQTITTTLDGALQNKLQGLDEPLPGKDAGIPGRIVVIRQGDRIRGMMCAAGKDALVRTTLDSLGPGYKDHSFEEMPWEAVSLQTLMSPTVQAPQDRFRTRHSASE